MKYLIKISTPYSSYYLEDLTKSDLINFKDELNTFLLSENYGFFSLIYNGEEVLLGYQAVSQSEIVITKIEE